MKSKEEILNAKVKIDCGYEDIVIPVSDFVDEDEIEDIVNNSDSDREIDWEIQDLAYDFLTDRLTIKVSYD